MRTFSPKGCFTALVTPFTEDGSGVDWAAYEALVERQIAGGVAGVVPCGTTAEAPTLTDAEQTELVERAAKVAAGRVAVLAGTGSNSTKKTIETSRAALEAGADAVMVVMPYYNKPSQAGLAAHVEAVAGAVPAPVVLYNIPGRTGVTLEVSTLLRLLETCPNVVAIKDATGNVLQCQALAGVRGRFFVLCGDDALTVPMMSVGASGVISVTSNVYPREVSAVVSAMLDGRWEAAREAHLKMIPVHDVMFCEPSPAPAKAALHAKGLMSGALRLPMVPLSAANTARLRETLAAFEVVS
jgi:4-hydroxy-tetrahydrodipicolinate synthase